MQKIIPHLWFNTEAKEASEFYTKLIPDSKVISVKTITGTPSGDCDIVSFSLAGQDFMAISAGPYFKINPSISFFINFDPSIWIDAREKIDQVWNVLADGGKILMPIQEYPFSKRYGWVEDKYGVSWQLILTNPEGDERPIIIPSLLFVGDVCGKAEEAGAFYTSIFKNSKKGSLARYGEGQPPNTPESVMFSEFKLENLWFVAMDSAIEHQFAFNEAISFIVHCDTQEEIDYYSNALSTVPEAEQCGWLKDKYGISWQIVPTIMDTLMMGDRAQTDRVTQAFLTMKRFNIDELKKAARG